MTPALLAACALVLLASAVAHARRLGALLAGMAAHGVLPPATRTPLAWAVLAAETALGIAALVALATAHAGWALAVGALTTVLFAAMTAYVHVAHRRTAGSVPCACGIGEAPLGAWVTARAALLAACAGVATIAASLAVADGRAWGVAGRPADELAVLACAAVALAVAIALLPAARTAPTGLVLTPGGAR